MKLEILKKLVALANNNPNDHEANTAARRVCKALAEDKFIDQLSEPITRAKTPDFKSNPPPPQPNPNTNQYNPYSNAYRNPSDIWEEFFGNGFRKPYGGPQWDKQTQERRKEPKQKDVSEKLAGREKLWKYEYYVPASNTYYCPLSATNYTKMFQDQWFEETGFRHSSDTKEFRKGANYGKPQEEHTTYTYGGTRQEDFFNKGKHAGELRKLRCKTCREVFNTRFVGLAELFECNECQFTAYTKGNETKKPPVKDEKIVDAVVVKHQYLV